MHSFLGVTVRVFSDSNCHSYLLAFRAFTESHTGQQIADVLEETVAQNSLEGKIRHVVTDSASNVCKTMSVMFDVGDSLSSLNGSDVDDLSLWEDSITRTLIILSVSAMFICLIIERVIYATAQHFS